MSIMANEESPQEKLGEEVEVLKRQLKDATSAIHTAQSRLSNQQLYMNQTIMTLKVKLKKSQETIKAQRMQSDRQMGQVLAHLLFLEGQLKREQRDIRIILQEKNQIIQQQQEEIVTLTEKNDKLLSAINDLYTKKKSNGFNENIFNFDSETVEEIKNEKDKSGGRRRLSSMRERLWRHKSNLELNSHHRHALHNGSTYGSEENIMLSSGGRSEEDRERCMSVPEYPLDVTDITLQEMPDEMENSDSCTQKLNGHILEEDGETFQATPGNIDVSPSVLSEPQILLSVASMPSISMIETSGYNGSPGKNRPHSLSSVDLIKFQHVCVNSSPVSVAHSTSDESGGSLSSPISPNLSVSPTNIPSPSVISPSQESNPFKSFKTMLKRKGSKIKGKKRSVSLQQSTKPEYREAVEKHFQKHNLQ
ncbi:hypothetical protein ScPMuIL_010279 [Solemya velum]